jgi:predicted phage terminase large subunit-like protein
MWSPEDILNRIIEDREKLSPLEPDRHFKFTQISKDKSTVVIKVPMLDENDETTCKAVMTTKKARELRDVADPFQWACVYQQDPIPAEGLDFADDLLQHFESLPIDEDGNPLCDDYALAVLDTTRKGKDNASMPIFKSDGQNHYYLVDCIFKKKAMTDLYEEIIAKIEEHQITWLVVENNTDTSLKTLLDKMLEEKGILYCNITEKYQGNRRKELRIKDTQGIIRKMIYFKPKNKYKPNSDYGRLMKNLTTYSFDYPNRNDDAPDSLALFASEIILERGKPSKPIPVNRMSLGF